MYPIQLHNCLADCWRVGFDCRRWCHLQPVPQSLFTRQWSWSWSSNSSFRREEGNMRSFCSQFTHMQQPVLYCHGYNGAREWATTDYANPISMFLFRMYCEERRYIQGCNKYWCAGYRHTVEKPMRIVPKQNLTEMSESGCYVLILLLIPLCAEWVITPSIPPPLPLYLMCQSQKFPGGSMGTLFASPLNTVKSYSSTLHDLNDHDCSLPPLLSSPPLPCSWDNGSVF